MEKIQDGKSICLVFPDYYDATTACRRTLIAIKGLFKNISLIYWARQGFERKPDDNLFSDVKFLSYRKSAAPRSFLVLILFIKYQYWVLKNLLRLKPDIVHAFTLYTIVPCLIYGFFKRK